MEIVVHGKGSSFYKPDQVLLNLSFYVREDSYNKVLDKGSQSVLDFTKKILMVHGFVKEDMKTSSFYIKEEKVYNESTRKYDVIGYSYNQEAIIKFDYVKERLALIIDDISKMDNPPLYNVDFTVKDIEECKKNNLKKAYQDAKKQASIIAEAAGMTLKCCVRVNFEPFTTEYISKGYAREMAYKDGTFDSSGVMSVGQTINSVFTPMDVLISEDLYCLFEADV